MNIEKIKQDIELAWQEFKLLDNEDIIHSINQTIDLLDKGIIRIAQKQQNNWIVNEWIRKAILLYFRISPMQTLKNDVFEYHDKIPLKKNFKQLNIRVVPGTIIRYGCYIAPNVILMPSFVNIGAYIDSGTLIDTWATVGSCAQVGKNVHLSGGVGIGGVLEPVHVQPVIIEDGVFIGSRCILVEGARVDREAVIAAGTTITASTKIIDVTQSQPVEYKGYVPPRSVVIPGSYPKNFPAGQYFVNCALIIGQRKESTDLKTSLNQVLRDFKIPI